MEEVKLKDLRPGAIFVTHEGIYAVKSEYRYGSELQSQCECVLLESGEYAHFRDGNQTLVREVRLAMNERPVPGIGGTAFAHEHDPSKELMFIPKSTSIFPVISIDALWEIVQAVAEKDTTFDGDGDFDGVPLYHYCPFCDHRMEHAALERGEDFPHAEPCIVTKARVLLSQRQMLFITIPVKAVKSE